MSNKKPNNKTKNINLFNNNDYSYTDFFKKNLAINNNKNTHDNFNNFKHNFDEVIKNEQSKIKVYINPQVWKDVLICLDKCKDIEFSGIILYKKSGSLKNLSNIILEVEYFILMDIGTTGYTEFTMDDSLIEFCKKHEEIIPNTTHYIGKLHSHHNMDSYHSAIDIDDILLNLDNNTHYLSIVINNNLKLDTKLGIYKEINIKEEENFYDLNEKKEVLIKESKIKKAILYNCNTRLEFNINSTVDDKLNKLINQKTSNLYNTNNNYENTFSINKNNQKYVIPSKNSKFGYLPSIDLEEMLYYSETLEDDLDNVWNEILEVSKKESFENVFDFILTYLFPNNYCEKSKSILLYVLDNYLLYDNVTNGKSFTSIGYKIILSFIKAIYKIDKNNLNMLFKNKIINLINTNISYQTSFLLTVKRELTNPEFNEIKYFLKNNYF